MVREHDWDSARDGCWLVGSSHRTGAQRVASDEIKKQILKVRQE